MKHLFTPNPEWGPNKNLLQNGYVVVPVPDRFMDAKKFAEKFVAYARSIKVDPSNKHGITKLPACADICRELRLKVGRPLFSALWGVEPSDLRSSMDTFCYKPPREIKRPSRKNAHMLYYDADTGEQIVPEFGKPSACLNPWGWAHFDASHLYASKDPKDFLINGKPSTGGICDMVNFTPTVQCLYVPDIAGTAGSANEMTFACLPGSHLVQAEFYEAFPELKFDKAGKVNKKDWVRLNIEQIEWLEKKTGNKMQKIHVPPGHIVLWFSNVLHCNANPTFKSYGKLVKKNGKWVWVQQRVEPCAKTNERAAVYICMILQSHLGPRINKTWFHFVNGKTTSHHPADPRPNAGFQTYGQIPICSLSPEEYKKYTEDPVAFEAAAKAKAEKDGTKYSRVIPAMPLPPAFVEMSHEEATMYGWDPKIRRFEKHVKLVGDKVIIFPNYNPKNSLNFCDPEKRKVWQAKRDAKYAQVFPGAKAAPDFIPRLKPTVVGKPAQQLVANKNKKKVSTIRRLGKMAKKQRR